MFLQSCQCSNACASRSCWQAARCTCENIASVVTSLIACTCPLFCGDLFVLGFEVRLQEARMCIAREQAFFLALVDEVQPPFSSLQRELAAPGIKFCMRKFLRLFSRVLRFRRAKDPRLFLLAAALQCVHLPDDEVHSSLHALELQLASQVCAARQDHFRHATAAASRS